MNDLATDGPTPTLGTAEVAHRSLLRQGGSMPHWRSARGVASHLTTHCARDAHRRPMAAAPLSPPALSWPPLLMNHSGQHLIRTGGLALWLVIKRTPHLG